MSYKLKWDFTRRWLSPFSRQWLVAGSMNWYMYTSVCIYIYSRLLQSCHGLSIDLPSVLFFVCQLDASWGHWASKCCYYCYLFCTVEQWLLQLPISKTVWVPLFTGDYRKCSIFLSENLFQSFSIHIYLSIHPSLSHLYLS